MKTTRLDRSETLLFFRPVTERDKFDFYKQIAARKKERDDLKRRLNELNEPIQKKKMAIENIRTKYYAHRKDTEAFESWRAQKQAEVNSLITKKKELELQIKNNETNNIFTQLQLELDNLNKHCIKAASENKQYQITLEELLKIDNTQALTDFIKIKDYWKTYNAALLMSLNNYLLINQQITSNLQTLDVNAPNTKLKERLTNENEVIKTFLPLIQKNDITLDIFLQYEAFINENIAKNKERINTLKLLIEQNDTYLTKSESKKNHLLQEKKSIESENIQKHKAKTDKYLELTSLINAIEKKITDEKQKIQTLSAALTAESQQLENELKVLENDANKYISNIKIIDNELAQPISFTSAQSVSDKELNTLLFKQLSKSLAIDLAEKVALRIVQHCDWQKISNVSSAYDLSASLMKFYRYHIDKDPYITEDQYPILFNQFLMGTGIPIETRIPKNKIAKMRTTDSLARCLFSYIKALPYLDNIGPSIAVTIFDKEIKIAVNETGKADPAQQRKMIKTATDWLAEIITACPQGLEEQKKYIEKCIKNYFSTFDQKEFDRLFSDLLNIMQYHQSFPQKSLINKLKAVTDKDIYTGTGVYLFNKPYYLHANLLLLESISINHLLDCAKNGNEMKTIFPENKPIVIGMNNLADVHSYMLINALNKQDATILLTGTNHASSYKNTTLKFVCRKFFDRIQARIENEKKETIFAADYNKLSNFLMAKSKSLIDYLHDFRSISFSHYDFFKQNKNYQKGSDRSPRDIRIIENEVISHKKFKK